jgi:hypothetical protein
MTPAPRNPSPGDLVKLRDERGRLIGLIRHPVVERLAGRGAATIFAMPSVRPPASWLARQGARRVGAA